jgi:hypothetical protein
MADADKKDSLNADKDAVAPTDAKQQPVAEGD